MFSYALTFVHVVHPGTWDTALAVHGELVPFLLSAQGSHAGQRGSWRCGEDGGEVLASLLPAAVAADEDDHCEDDGSADGGAGCDHERIDVCGEVGVGANLATLARRHTSGSQVNLLQRHYAYHYTLLRRNVLYFELLFR